MLPKSHRLSRQDFLHVKKQTKSHHLPELSYITIPNNLPFSRYCVVTSTKFSKHAIIRNRIRRAIYDHLSLKSPLSNVDCIIFPKPSVLKLNHDQITTLIDQFVSEISHHRA